MSLEIKVPTVGESITEVTIAQWFKKEGESVEMDEVICELESDKATFELNAEAAGKLHIVAQEGDTLEIGALICKIDTAATPSNDKPSSTEAPKEDTTAAPKSTGEVKEMIVPTVGESITEVTLSAWLKKTGDFVKIDEIIAEIDSDKATFELPAEASGILSIIAEEGDTIEIGALICKIEVMEGEAPVDKAPKTESAATNHNATSQDKTYATGHASPAAAKLLAEKGIDSKTITGTGVDGRITKEDAEKAQKSAPVTKEVESKKEDSAPALNTSGTRNTSKEKMSSLRRTVAKRLVSVKNETAMLTTFNEVNMKPIMDIRKKYKESFKAKHEVGLGFMSFFTKAVTMAAKDWPAVNAQLDGNEIIYHDFVDVSIAVSAPKGLMVPVIRNAESMTFDQVEKEVVRLATKARDGKLTLEEMTGGTFTITNGGIFGSMLSTPIINSPQSAILGMHNIVERPMAVNGQVEILPIMYLALSYDHRIVDGRESVSFLVRVKELLEDPTRLLLGV
ncbi:MAG: 2-oxoglutarate dehydrogenase E2 component (dihydrolipoamide succinyltransferase) [Roseivirga sp.]|jgi:2-oxoglutarate dehydrogenase E2 component (dihydrolipoamide succinyltransferase)